MMRQLLFITLILFGCSHFNKNEEVYFSSRDLNEAEVRMLDAHSDSNFSTRSPADNHKDQCVQGISRFLGRKIEEPLVETSKTFGKIAEAKIAAIQDAEALAIKGLKGEDKVFSNGKKYVQYQANLNDMKNNASYRRFLEETIEIIFTPQSKFGHIKIRVGKRAYAFNNIKQVTNQYFNPILFNSSNPDLASSEGFVFIVGEKKIAEVENMIDKIFQSSEESNIPPFDAYSPLLKVMEVDSPMGKVLKFSSNSPSLGNNGLASGRILEEDGKFFLKAPNGVKISLVKKGNEFFAQSYSCSTVAGMVAREFFGIKLGQDVSAKYLLASLQRGNLGQGRSPDFVIKYHDEN